MEPASGPGPTASTSRSRLPQVAGSGCRAAPGDASLSAEEPATRTPDRDRAPVNRAPRPPDRTGGPVVGRHLFVGVRDRADPLRPGEGDRGGGVLARDADHPRGHRGPRLRDALVPRGREGLHEGRRRLRGIAGEFRAQGRPGRGHVASDRLHPHCRGFGRGGRGGPDVGVPVTYLGDGLDRCGRSSSSSPTSICAGSARPGRVFALPTYFFVANMVILIVVGPSGRSAGPFTRTRSLHHPGSVDDRQAGHADCWSGRRSSS